ncbi:MAG: hypothetical protein A2W90_11105 [Bacteroidetes bacterium GWF2_42_66]|nr:MAG: hypothetical protein A2W92_10095 [Bacteroidetes bacterium GWA2_42_15]OFY01874.1 MAG: hypothetical protein A2W89_23465 [Bacteroidetes bacterium GWE2_42_39]OFY44830.1 MAG: hypothetical protein A2W90_11105 [Bacteroidetes bacterium GWF2_42_66]HBL75956.1 hypothetical protein [Prolixibacteraceae bacterium]HCR89763.1 hypothetical protein [Prolixibacteraceae bacterium]
METFKFKTNVSCGGCIAKVTPHLNQVKDIKKWSVDTSTSQKILTVEADGVSPDKIVQALNNAGYIATLISAE